jgi:hypothetical protein
MAPTPKKRVLRPGAAIDQNQLQAVQHNKRSGGMKNLPVGPDFYKQGSDAFVAGRDVSSGAQVAPGTICYFYNNNAAVAWVTFSTAAPAAPSSFTTGRNY